MQTDNILVNNFVKPIFLLLLFSAALFAQQKPVMSRSEYNSKLDSLTGLKEKLTAERDAIKKQIDSLTKKSADLDSDLKTALRTVYIKRYGKKIGNRIINKQVWKGMTEKMLRDSWGKPDKITKNQEKWGLFTQWYYGKITFFFRDGKLTDWEEQK